MLEITKLRDYSRGRSVAHVWNTDNGKETLVDMETGEIFETIVENDDWKHELNS
ncbi:hypothetical protein MHI02_05690 [Oceanobacillus sp. FSL K6-0118]|uniref:hypothetical protein n=1 Tax=Oceanobacillus sp. FSL K6-0118 TaxID=2921418 RepID=UPI0030FA881F